MRPETITKALVVRIPGYRSDIRFCTKAALTLTDTVANFECRTHAIHDCGDHHIVIGEVIDYRYADIEPLVCYSGRYENLARTIHESP